MRRNTKPAIILVISGMLLISLSLSISAGIGSSLEITGFVTGLAGLCYNHMPVFDPYDTYLYARESVPFQYDMNITDPSLGLIYYWTDNSTFFNISSYTGRFSFTVPDRDDDYWVGMYPVLITFDDGIGCINSIINTTLFINLTWMNHQPQIVDSYPANNRTITEEQVQNFNITFRDTDNENNFTYDDNNLSVSWYIDGILVKNETSISPRNWSEYTYVPDYNSSGLKVVYVYVNDGEFSDMRYWLVDVTDVYVNATITQPMNGTSLLLFDNYTIFADISTFENRSGINCNISLDIANKTVFDIISNESYSHFVNYIGGLSTSTQQWNIHTLDVGATDINITVDCEQGGWTYDEKYTISVNTSERFDNLSLPEGIYYNEPSSLPASGNYQYKFNISFLNLTTHSDRILGCFINQSNCYDKQLPGCKQIFVNKTTLYGIAFYNDSISYTIQDDDIINSTLGGATDNWIPWQVDRCGQYYLNMTPIYEQDTTWRIHVHPIEWTTGDIANSLNAKSAANQYMKNTIHADSQGDVTFSVTKYGGTKVELVCNDGIDNPEESDTLADCADPECYGITYSCAPKQDFDNALLFYSPSGSHGTLAAVIPEGDIAENTSSAATFNTEIQYTMHVMPNGTLKIRLRKWGLSKTATFFIDGLPEIKSVDKSAPGSGSAKGMMLYFLDRNGDPYYSDHLPQNMSYSSRIALRSYISGGTEIQNLDTVINISFADPASINMSEGHVVEITINYVEESTPYEEKINITVYFDDPTYNNGTQPRWDSTNEREDDIMIAGAGWYPCNDTKNGDFDFLNCNGNEENCFEQSSYDCYDLDCDQKSGPGAWNAYTSMFTTGLCAYYNESQTAAMCFDSYNNDWRTEDITLGHNNTGLSLVDCRDSDCSFVSNGIWQCEYNIELTCDDGYDNDMYNLKDCELKAGGGIDDAEYDCSEFCRNQISIYTETGVFCNDNIDNDWDMYYTTTGGPAGYALNTTFGSGIDCAWGDSADEDCNMTIMSSGYRCELGHEVTCDDSFDNDYDLGQTQPDPGWTASAYFSAFNQTFAESADYDDYDCQYAPKTPVSESLDPSWCFDNIDNDLDAYYWDSSWHLNASTGKDCYDNDCLGAVNPANHNQSCLLHEYNSSDPFFDGLPEPDLYCKNGFDDDADGSMDCYDPDCNKQFDMCYACPANENISWDACADNIDNDYGMNTDCADTDCIGYLGDYDHHICAAAGGENTLYLCTDGFDNDNDNKIDCADSGCRGIAQCSAENCNDDIDNDGDGLLDCMDPGCSASCDINTDMGGTYAPPVRSSAVFGSVNVTWDARVRNGTNYTISLLRQEDYNYANIYIGKLTGAALPVGTGLAAEQFSISGPNASSFESTQYNEDATNTKAQIEVLDQVPGLSQSGFNITIEIPADSTLSSRSFEYYHSIDGIPSVGNMIGVIIVDNIKPHIQNIVTEPTAKDSLDYSSSIWVGVKAVDEENGDYHDGTIDRCYYNVSGPGVYFAAGDDTDDCMFEFGNLTDDGIYALTVWAQDDTGNYADPVTKHYTIDLKPKYITGSFNLTDRWYTIGDNLSLTAQFNTDDAASISYCAVWYRNSTGSPVFAGNITASDSGDMLECSGSIILPSADEMYELWVNITDAEGDTAKAASETFFVCNDGKSSGTGINGEIWSCIFADINEDKTLDVCEQKEIMISLKKHDNPDPIRVGDNELNYTISYINRGYGTAENVTIIEEYSLNTTFINSTPGPDIGINIWNIGSLDEFANGTISINVITDETFMNGTIITNIVSLTYYNSTFQQSVVSVEENTTVRGNTPPEFIKDLPKHHEVMIGDTRTLEFDLDDYVYDPDLEYGDYLVFNYTLEKGGGNAEITITPQNNVIVKGIKVGSVILSFNVTDLWGEYNISSSILIVVKPIPAFRKPTLCIEDWECSHWSRCGPDRLRYRSCIEKNKCRTEINKPREIELCQEIVPHTCYDRKKNFGESGIDCGGPCGFDCCSNGYKDVNLGEKGIDCGGRCARECPILEEPMPFIFNEMLGVLISIILLMIIMLVPKSAMRIVRKAREVEMALQQIGRMERKSYMHRFRERYRKMVKSVKEPEKKRKKKE